jgi:hypothetical protein
MKAILKKTQWFAAMITLCFIVVALFVTTGCDKNENFDKDELCFHAKVENSSKYNNIVEVKLIMRNGITHEDVELAHGDWKDGSFTIILPKINRNNYREFVNYRILPKTIIEKSTTITISNKDARSGTAEFLGVDKEGNVVTRFFPHRIDEDGNMAKVYFKYINTDVNISGYIEAGVSIEEYDEYINADIMWWWKNYTIYSIEYREGWNVSSFQSYLEETIIDKESTTSIHNLKWYGGNSWWELD